MAEGLVPTAPTCRAVQSKGLGSALAWVRGGEGVRPHTGWVWRRMNTPWASERQVLEHALPGPSAGPVLGEDRAGGRAAAPHPRAPFCIVIGMSHDP